eukprot:COSAG01_NODE_5345_length_4320_cov_64.852168_8_plen_183_part_00
MSRGAVPRTARHSCVLRPNTHMAAGAAGVSSSICWGNPCVGASALPGLPHHASGGERRRSQRQPQNVCSASHSRGAGGHLLRPRWSACPPPTAKACQRRRATSNRWPRHPLAAAAAAAAAGMPSLPEGHALSLCMVLPLCTGSPSCADGRADGRGGGVPQCPSTAASRSAPRLVLLQRDAAG